MRLGPLRQFWQDMLRLDAALGPAMRVIGPLVALAVLILGCRAKDLSERETRVIKRSYVIKPDQTQSLRYEAKRVRLRNLFWKD